MLLEKFKTIIIIFCVIVLGIILKEYQVKCEETNCNGRRAKDILGKNKLEVVHQMCCMKRCMKNVMTQKS